VKGPEPGRRYIWKPTTNHGGLRDLWDAGVIKPGARVRLIELRSRGEATEVVSARLLPGWWRVVSPPQVLPGDTTTVAIIEPEGDRRRGDEFDHRQQEEGLAAAGLRPVQFLVPDTHAPGFAEAVRRQCLEIAAAEGTPEGREEAAFWDGVTAEAWDGLE
jgi:hypothetical protein